MFALLLAANVQTISGKFSVKFRYVDFLQPHCNVCDIFAANLQKFKLLTPIFMRQGIYIRLFVYVSKHRGLNISRFPRLCDF